MKKPDDSYYLQNDVIADIFKSNDSVKVSHVFTRIELKYKKIFLSRVALNRHYLLSDEVLAAISQEAFNEAQKIFYDQVRTGQFEMQYSGFGNYLFMIFKNQYRNYYRKELVHKKYNNNIMRTSASSIRMSEDIPAYNKPEGIYNTIRLAISKLKPNCERLITLQFLQDKEADEVVEITKLKNKRSVNQQTFLCRDHLKKILTQEFGIEC